MTDSAIRVYAPRAVTFPRSKRVRRFWGSIGATLRHTTDPSAKASTVRGSRELRIALRGN